MSALYFNPAKFAFDRLGKLPYDWQIDGMLAVGQGWPTSVVAANGSGKTSDLIAPVILAFLDAYPRGQAVVTSGSFRQIEKQLWPAMRAHRHACPDWSFLTTEIKTPQGGFALGFSTDDPGRAEGWHPKISNDVDPVLIVVDEAKTVPEGVFEAFDRCTRLFQLWTSSPGAPRGQFYESHHSRKSQFFTLKVRSDQCPHIDPVKREKDRQTYGEDHPVFRSMHLAEFTADTDRMVIDSQRLAKALEGQPEPNEKGETVAFCDFAAGRDENVLAIRRGNKARIIEAWREKDTVQAARRFMMLFEREELKASQIWGDADGLGIGFVNEFAERGWRINHFRGGTASTEPADYANLIGEVWHVGAREIERGRVNLGQIDPETFRQLTTRRSEWSENGKLRVEPKEKMAKEGLKSPDRADALLGCIGCGYRLTNSITDERVAGSVVPTSDFASPTVQF